MKKKLIIGVLVLISIVLVVGSVFAIQSDNVKNSNVYLADESYNQKIHDKKPDLKYSESYSGTDYNNENNQLKSGDYIQGLILAPMVITKAICQNQYSTPNHTSPVNLPVPNGTFGWKTRLASHYTNLVDAITNI